MAHPEAPAGRFTVHVDRIGAHVRDLLTAAHDETLAESERRLLHVAARSLSSSLALVAEILPELNRPEGPDRRAKAIAAALRAFKTEADNRRADLSSLAGSGDDLLGQRDVEHSIANNLDALADLHRSARDMYETLVEQIDAAVSR